MEARRTHLQSTWSRQRTWALSMVIALLALACWLPLQAAEAATDDTYPPEPPEEEVLGRTAEVPAPVGGVGGADVEVRGAVLEQQAPGFLARTGLDTVAGLAAGVSLVLVGGVLLWLVRSGRGRRTGEPLG